MRIFIVPILFILSSCAYLGSHSYHLKRRPSQLSQSTIAQSKEVHLVLDIDWTIVRPLELENIPEFEHTQRVLSLSKDDHYLLMEGTREILDFASENPWLKITFFSGGHRARNLKLLDMVKDSKGITAKQIAHKVLSNEELTVVSQDESLRFSHRFKKDLTKAHPNLEEVIFVDDLKHFALDNGGLERTAWVGKTYHPWPEGMELEQYQTYWLEQGKKAEHLAPDQEAGFWAKRKLFLLLSALEQEGANPEAIHRNLTDLDLSRDRYELKKLEELNTSPSYQRFLSGLECPVPVL